MNDAKRSTLAAAQLVSYYYIDSLPADEKIVQNFLEAVVFNNSSSASGTLQSLINSGQLQLIENMQLRSALVKLASSLHDFEKVSKYLAYQKLWQQIMAVIEEVDLHHLILAHIPKETYNVHIREDSLSPFFAIDRPAVSPLPLHQLFENEILRKEFTTHYLTFLNYYRQTEAILTEIEKAEASLVQEAQRLKVRLYSTATEP